jgi:hypothetical protein
MATINGDNIRDIQFYGEYGHVDRANGQDACGRGDRRYGRSPAHRRPGRDPGRAHDQRGPRCRQHGVARLAVSGWLGGWWSGPGTVARVTPRQAELLSRYPDQWQLGEGVELPKAEEIEQKLAQVHEQGAERATGVGTGGRRLEDMEADELVAHADRYYGLALDPALPKEELLDKISEAVQSAGQDAEFERNKAIDAPGTEGAKASAE